MPSTPDLFLVLDLSASLCLGIVDSPGRTLSCRVKEQGTRGETAHALLDECLAEAGREISALAAVCVGVGPGSFTGIRVCAALAQGLAFPKRLPLYPFSSLAALAVCAPVLSSEQGNAPEAARLVAAIAANAGRYFVRFLPSGGAPESGGVEILLAADELLALGNAETHLITSGNIPDRDRLLTAFGALSRFEERVDFGAIARMALRGSPVLDGVLRPNYLMASAAEEKRRAEGPAPGPPATGDTRK